MRIRELMMRAREQNYKVFIPYIMCGDPSLAVTKYLVRQLSLCGADVIELGVPFSDPIADGEVNQRAAERALKNKVSMNDCCKLVRALREDQCDIPIVLFTYFNPLLKYGLSEFAKLAFESGVDAVLVVDLPVEEAGELAYLLKLHQVGMVSLIAPTTSAERIQQACQLQPDFHYYISRAGVTGVHAGLSVTLREELAFVRAHTSLPVVVGFGISTCEQVRIVSEIADGVVVGSALVQELEGENGCSELLRVAEQLMSVIHSPLSLLAFPSPAAIFIDVASIYRRGRGKRTKQERRY